jgi:hypothetical protein
MFRRAVRGGRPDGSVYGSLGRLSLGRDRLPGAFASGSGARLASALHHSLVFSPALRMAAASTEPVLVRLCSAKLKANTKNRAPRTYVSFTTTLVAGSRTRKNWPGKDAAKIVAILVLYDYEKHQENGDDHKEHKKNNAQEIHRIRLR